MDAGFQSAEYGDRYTKRDTRVRPTIRNIIRNTGSVVSTVPTLTVDPAKIEPLRIGHLSIYPYSVTFVLLPEDIPAGPEYNPSEGKLQLPSLETKSKYHGFLAYSLIRGLDGYKESPTTYSQWFVSASKSSQDHFVVLGEHEGEQWVSGMYLLDISRNLRLITQSFERK